MTNISAPELSGVSWLEAFWRTLKRIDQSKLNSLSMSLRNALAVALPLGIGIAWGYPLAGVAVATGALNVSYSDGRDPYAHRARRMLSWSVLGAVAVFLGCVTGNYLLLGMIVSAGWAFAAGMMVSISTRAADIGLNSLVTLVVYAARGAQSPKGALITGLLVLGGGLLQTSFALLFWPLRRNGPERRAVGRVYLDFARQLDSPTEDVLAAPLKQPSAEVQDTLAALGRDHSVEGERFRLLFDQADRLRFSIFVISRLRADLQKQATQEDWQQRTALCAAQLLELSAKLINETGAALLNDQKAADRKQFLQELHRLELEAQAIRKSSSAPLAGEFASAADVLAGQLRVATELSEHTTTLGSEEFAQSEFAPPWKLQLGNWLATLRANLHLRSSACRHGLRLALCVAIADALSHSINVQRTYWLPMTVAVVLKPDFSTTISRGILRLCGTFGGLLLATGLFHVVPQSAATELVLVGIFTFLLRYAGPANYGLFSVAISGLIVFLIAVTGVAPSEVITERAINTTLGGVFALVAYALWPTWERSQVSEVLAEMIDRIRAYFHAVVQRFSVMGEQSEAELDRTRSEWRQARSSAEASVDRVFAEPGVNPARLGLLTSILASSQSLAKTILGMEAGITQRAGEFPLPAFDDFAHDVEFTLYFLAAALRGSQAATETLPRVRDDYRRLVEARDEFSGIDDYVLTETDRLTVSLNTLREKVLEYVT